MNSGSPPVQSIEVRYGRGFQSVEVPLDNLGQILCTAETTPIHNPALVLSQAVRSPISTRPLKELARGKHTCCILVSDQTRPVPNSVILPVLIDELNRGGISNDAITLLIANGTHDPVPETRFVNLLGEETMGAGVQIMNHSAYNYKDLVYLDDVICGTPVFVNSRYVSADLKIVTGLVEPHFMAGYSGGRKSICPGIVGIDTLKTFHGTQVLLHPKSRSCALIDNPVNEIACAVADLVGCDFMVNVTVNSNWGITGVYAGCLRDAHQRACSAVSQSAQVCVAQRAPIVITSGGGYPLDQSYYQTIKGMVEALPALEKEGTLIIASQCSAGIGKDVFAELLEEFKYSSSNTFIAKYRKVKNFRSDQWQVIELIKVLGHVGFVYLLSDLSPSEFELTQAEPIRSLEEGLRTSLKIHGGASPVHVIPEGPYVVPKTEPPDLAH